MTGRKVVVMKNDILVIEISKDGQNKISIPCDNYVSLFDFIDKVNEIEKMGIKVYKWEVTKRTN